MSMRRIALLGSLLTLAAVQQASAEFLRFDYTGTVYRGTDTSGIFGQPGRDLTGSSVSIDNTYDLTQQTNSGGLSVGGTFYGFAHSVRSTISIGGEQFSMPDYVDNILNSVGNYHYESIGGAIGLPYSFTGLEVLLYGTDIPFNAESILPAGGFYFGHGDFSTTQDNELQAYAYFNINTVTVTSSAFAVPLPDTLQMFGVALLTLGVAGLRLQSSKA